MKGGTVSESANDLWYLRPGILLPVAAILSVLNLERAGHRLTLSEDGQAIDLERAPGVPLDPHDVAELRRHKIAAIEFLKYSPPAIH